MCNNTTIQICNESVTNSKSQKLLGVIIDTELRFNTHVTDLCNKASKKLNALTRVSPYMDLPKKRSLMKSFISSQFNYSPCLDVT